MNLSQFSKGFLLFLAGVSCGWFIAQYQKSSTDNLHHAAITEPAITTATQPVTKESAVVWLHIETDGNTKLAPGIVIKDNDVIVASLHEAYPASRIYLKNPNDETPEFLQVRSANAESGLVALSYAGDSNNGFPISNEDGSLYIGKSLRFVLPDRVISAQVDSSLQRDAAGRERYAIEFQGGTNFFNGPLIDASSNRLVGFVPGGSATDADEDAQQHTAYSAVDAGQIRQLLATRFTSTMSMDQFNAHWATTPAGLRVSLRKLSELRRWRQAYQVAREVWQQDVSSADAAQLLTEVAYINAHRLLQGGDVDQAMALSTEMAALFPSAKPWCVIDALGHQAAGNWSRAIDRTEYCLAQDHSLYDQFNTGQHPASIEARTLLRFADSDALIELSRNLAMAANDDTNSSTEQKRELLQRAIAIEQHAVLYKLLGDIEYTAQRYELAQQYYQQAIALDASIASLLGNRLQNSQQRARTTPITEVDFENRRGALVVTAYLNDHPQSFRLLLDTGATFSAVSTATILRLGLREIFAYGAPLIELESAAGRIYAQKFTLESMRIGSARVDHVPVVILEDLDGYDGLVGLSFLSHFDVNLDQQAGKLILTRQ